MPDQSTILKIYHELDLNVKPVKKSSADYFPLQIVVEYNDNKVLIDSKISSFFRIYSSELDRYVNCEKEIRNFLLSNLFRKEDIAYFEKEKAFPFYHMMNDEKEVIRKIINLNVSNEKASFMVSEDLIYEFEKYTSEITELMDEQIKTTYLDEVKKIFIKSIDNDDDKDIFNLTNYLLHYINWNNSFYNFYETTCDLIYRPLKNLENRFDNAFKTQLKAFLAFHSKVKVLKRFFEKRELGKITTISYLDWKTDIRDFLLVEFEKIFGEQRAIEYILSIDQLLINALENKHSKK